ncbi:hypothetical protein [Dolichospermum circinale]|uniref:hypothetical protein n=1 Tax=Dolichospermum circinale TaxID=109265 RepID=UPI00232D4C73|nr:hypothetical protein [Dolichospermum circinale]MDB9466192.1 hypothetical protein [Dolichospermum circinale CS-539/09]MDB9471425.1 hypothetical protein [Dolichospermum circinale CS-539]
MTTTLTKVQQFLDSGDSDGAREEVANISVNFKKVDATVRDFATLLALGSQQVLEISLGVLGRELLKKDLKEVNKTVIWLFISSILSRHKITSDSPSRISIIGLISYVQDWELPIFALLSPALDSFFMVSLAEENPLISEQTVDFISTWGENYAKAPRTRKQIKKFESLIQLVLDKVDDEDIKDEWTEGVETFLRIAGQKQDNQYSDQGIWSEASNLLKKIYSPEILNSDQGANYYQVKDNIHRLITSCLAALGTVFNSDSLSIAVSIDNPEENTSWSILANAVDKLETLFQEIADVTFDKITKLPTFIPAQAIPGSWTIILHLNISDNQSNLLANTIKSLSSAENAENEIDSSIIDSWQDCVAKFKENELRVNLAVSSKNPELYFVNSISTEDIPKVEESVQQNIRVISRDIPQADNLERVIDFASLLIQYPSSSSTVRQSFLEIEGIGERQYFYYRRAVEILNLANERQEPTASCYILYRLQNEAKKRFLAYQFISSKIGVAWFNWYNANDLSEIQPESATQFLLEVCPKLSEKTVKRRAITLKSWLKIFLKYW